MTESNLERSHSYNTLWPQIADALDTFLRRRDQGMDSYEKVWRLIHVWEATVTTLSSVAIAAFRSNESTKEQYRTAREYCYGRKWDPVEKAFKTFEGALDGSIGRWTEILFLVKGDGLPVGFLTCLRDLLDSEAVSLKGLVEPWKTACDVPLDVQQGGAKVRDVIRHVNSFRNRFAHVPFPYDPLEQIANGLESATEQLFSIAPLPWLPNSPLSGAIITRTRVLLGVHNKFNDAGSAPAHPCFAFPAKAKKGEISETIDSRPFLYVDRMLRPHVLTRLKNRDIGRWEFTRFRAEANAVISVDDNSLFNLFPIPAAAEYPEPEEAPAVTPDESALRQSTEGQSVNDVATADVVLAPLPDADLCRPAETMGDAISAMRSGQFDVAMRYLERLTRERPSYHVGWLRLGHAQREKAVRLAENGAGTAIPLLHDSLESFTQAMGHVSDSYRAQSLYERSKSFYHLFRLNHKDEHRDSAYRDAHDAASLSPDLTYLSWVEFLDRLSANFTRTSAGSIAS